MFSEDLHRQVSSAIRFQRCRLILDHERKQMKDAPLYVAIAL